MCSGLCGPWSATTNHLIEQFSHTWYFPCYQCMQASTPPYKKYFSSQVPGVSSLIKNRSFPDQLTIVTDVWYCPAGANLFLISTLGTAIGDQLGSLEFWRPHLHLQVPTNWMKLSLTIQSKQFYCSGTRLKMPKSFSLSYGLLCNYVSQSSWMQSDKGRP